MTAKEAILKLIEYRRRLERDFEGTKYCLDAEPFDMAIQALEHTPERTQTHSCDYSKKETHGDVIYRQDAIDAIRHIEEIYVNNLPTMIDKASAQTELMLLPSAQPERKTGRWIKISPAGIYECSKCGGNLMTGDIECYEFCHQCGSYNGGEK